MSVYEVRLKILSNEKVVKKKVRWKQPNTLSSIVQSLQEWGWNISAVIYISELGEMAAQQMSGKFKAL